MINWIRYTCIFCYALICKVNLSFCIQCNVLKKSVAFDCIVDIWFGFFIQVNNFCVASTFKVEYAVVIPAMFVITNKELSAAQSSIQSLLDAQERREQLERQLRSLETESGR